MTDKETQRDRLIEQMRRQLGPDICKRLTDPDVTDLLLNADGTFFEDRVGVGMQPIGSMTPDAAGMFISTAAAMAGEVITAARPIIETELFNGARFEGLMPPVVPAPVFAIRCHANRIFTLADYEAAGIMTRRQRQAIEQAVRERKNIVVSGGTRSGKTTLCNAIAQEVARVTPDDRVLVLEDTVELQCPNRNVVAMRSSDTVTHRTLLRAALRLRPDRIVIGEVRGGEALDMLKAWNTGHDGGFCTVHANDVRSTLTRLEQLIAEVSAMPMQRLIAEAVDLVISISRDGTGRRVQEIARLTDFDGDYILKPIGV